MEGLNDSRIYDLFQKLSDDLHQTTQTIRDMLAKHEARISVLEERTSMKTDMKDDLIKWLLRALIIAGTTVAALTGAGGLLQNILTRS